MSKQTFTLQNKLNNLHDEIIAARPDLKNEAVVEGDGDKVIIYVPNDIDDSFIATMVAAHDSTKLSAVELIEAQVNADAATLKQYLADWDRLDDKQKDDVLLRLLRSALRAL